MLMAAVALVAVSLTLNGVVTWYLAQQQEVSAARDQLAKNVLILRTRIMPLLTCPQRTPTTPNAICTKPAETEFLDSLSAHQGEYVPLGERLILLDKPVRAVGLRPREPHVLFDSGDAGALGTPLPLGRKTQVLGQNVWQGQAELGGGAYLTSAIMLGPGAPYISAIVLARSRDAVANDANSQLLQPLLVSATVGLLLAVVAAALLGRMFSRPLGELKEAAQDIAGGNYSRRVRLTGRDEIGVVGAAFNRMAEGVERARAQQRGFLANVSHELKTPLTSLIGFTQAFMDGSLQSQDDKERAATILHEEAQRVLRMSQELLDLARAESGQLTLNLHPVDLAAQLQQEIEIVRPRADSRGLVLQLAAPGSLPPVTGDPDRLHQILENLLDNAIKYAPEKTSIWISAEARPGGRIVTSVTNKVGSVAPDPERMFDRFYRADGSRSAGGAGLGLAICRELAGAQDARLTAELAADGNLCMRLDLPAAMQPPLQVDAASRLSG